MTEPQPSKPKELDQFLSTLKVHNKDVPCFNDHLAVAHLKQLLHPTTSSDKAHNHTPWPVYKQQLTSNGYSVTHVNEIIEGLEDVWNCPACDEAKETSSNGTTSQSPTAPDVQITPSDTSDELDWENIYDDFERLDSEDFIKQMKRLLQQAYERGVDDTIRKYNRGDYVPQLTKEVNHE